MTEQKACVACGHEIDAAARLCPYCGADPETGKRFDPKPILERHFPARDLSRSTRAREFFRERQALVVTGIIIGVFLLIGAAHQFASRRAASADPNVPPVPLAELASLNDEAEREELPIPELEFSWTGRPESMKVMLIEPGAVPPPPEEQAKVLAPPRRPAPQPAPAEASTPRPTPPAPTETTTAPASEPAEVPPTQTSTTTPDPPPPSLQEE